MEPEKSRVGLLVRRLWLPFVLLSGVAAGWVGLLGFGQAKIEPPKFDGEKVTPQDTKQTSRLVMERAFQLSSTKLTDQNFSFGSKTTIGLDGNAVTFEVLDRSNFAWLDQAQQYEFGDVSVYFFSGHTTVYLFSKRALSWEKVVEVVPLAATLAHLDSQGTFLRPAELELSQTAIDGPPPIGILPAHLDAGASEFSRLEANLADLTAVEAAMRNALRTGGDDIVYDDEKITVPALNGSPSITFRLAEVIAAPLSVSNRTSPESYDQVEVLEIEFEGSDSFIPSTPLKLSLERTKGRQALELFRYFHAEKSQIVARLNAVAATLYSGSSYGEAAALGLATDAALFDGWHETFTANSVTVTINPLTGVVAAQTANNNATPAAVSKLSETVSGFVNARSRLQTQATSWPASAVSLSSVNSQLRPQVEAHNSNVAEYHRLWAAARKVALGLVQPSDAYASIGAAGGIGIAENDIVIPITENLSLRVGPNIRYSGPKFDGETLTYQYAANADSPGVVPESELIAAFVSFGDWLDAELDAVGENLTISGALAAEADVAREPDLFLTLAQKFSHNSGQQNSPGVQTSSENIVLTAAEQRAHLAELAHLMSDRHQRGLTVPANGQIYTSFGGFQIELTESHLNDAILIRPDNGSDRSFLTKISGNIIEIGPAGSDPVPDVLVPNEDIASVVGMAVANASGYVPQPEDLAEALQLLTLRTPPPEVFKSDVSQYIVGTPASFATLSVNSVAIENGASAEWVDVNGVSVRFDDNHVQVAGLPEQVEHVELLEILRVANVLHSDETRATAALDYEALIAPTVLQTSSPTLRQMGPVIVDTFFQYRNAAQIVGEFAAKVDIVPETVSPFNTTVLAESPTFTVIYQPPRVGVASDILISDEQIIFSLPFQKSWDENFDHGQPAKPLYLTELHREVATRAATMAAIADQLGYKPLSNELPAELPEGAQRTADRIVNLIEFRDRLVELEVNRLPRPDSQNEALTMVYGDDQLRLFVASGTVLNVLEISEDAEGRLVGTIGSQTDFPDGAQPAISTSTFIEVIDSELDLYSWLPMPHRVEADTNIARTSFSLDLDVGENPAHQARNFEPPSPNLVIAAGAEPDGPQP